MVLGCGGVDAVKDRLRVGGDGSCEGHFCLSVVGD